MKLVCHIGAPHTEADLIQANLIANANWLLSRGIAYGDVMARGSAHDTLWAACAVNIPPLAANYGVTDANDQKELRRRIGEALAWQRAQLPAHVDCLVLSCASFYGAMTHPKAIRLLHDLLNAHFDEMELVVYVRRQDDAILADYIRAVRFGNTVASLSDHATACMDREKSITPYLFYKQELQKWLDVWGEKAVILRRYSLSDFIEGSPITDFLGVLLNSWDPDKKGFEPVLSSQPPLSGPTLTYLRNLSKTLRTEDTTSDKSDARRVLHQVQRIPLPPKPRPIMSADLSRKIMSHFTVANQWLQQKFSPDIDVPFFPERLDHPEFGNTDRLSTEEAVFLSSQIIKSLTDKNK